MPFTQWIGPHAKYWLVVMAENTMYALHVTFQSCAQSNMYQCQMGKQTMVHLCSALKQAANKLYRLQTPSAPL
ncbi:DNA-directed RNA polymerase I subunit RPA2 [Eumeta japonica]|uniref:DNA-directed RNA polymerase I subunit RPA2 n=1 Tax=Eumeta variegata TaxID=151549 RepID=A0A4C1TSZ3_EUMVA|nr:DNA-directed RNA polymerase I subunit RPA2 [Eumeta japonica]